MPRHISLVAAPRLVGGGAVLLFRAAPRGFVVSLFRGPRTGLKKMEYHVIMINPDFLDHNNMFVPE